MHSKDYQAHEALRQTAHEARRRRPMAVRVPTYAQRRREALRALVIDALALVFLALVWYAGQIMLHP